MKNRVEEWYERRRISKSKFSRFRTLEDYAEHLENMLDKEMSVNESMAEQLCEFESKYGELKGEFISLSEH